MILSWPSVLGQDPEPAIAPCVSGSSLHGSSFVLGK